MGVSQSRALMVVDAGGASPAVEGDPRRPPNVIGRNPPRPATFGASGLVSGFGGVPLSPAAPARPARAGFPSARAGIGGLLFLIGSNHQPIGEVARPSCRFHVFFGSRNAELTRHRLRGFRERARQDLNLRPFAPEANALSPELRARGGDLAAAYRPARVTRCNAG